MEKVRSASIFVLALSVFALVPAGAQAARAWQPAETLSSTAYPINTGDQRSVQLDDSGNAILGLNNFGGGYRWGYRPAGGPLGAAHTFPAATGLGSALSLFAGDSAGNVLTWDSGFWSSYRPAGAASDFNSGQLTTGKVLYDVAVAPTGEALGFFRSSDGHGWLAFRPAGASAVFDLANATELTPGGGDTSITPLGVTIDADGAAAAVYKSNPSENLVQTTRPATANAPFGSVATIANKPAASGNFFDRAADGTAVVLSRSGPADELRASVRPPGGSFGAEVNVATAASGETILGSPLVAAVDGGDAVVAFNRTRDGGCGANNDERWEAIGYANGGGWSALASGNGNWPFRSAVDGLDASGSKVALLVRSYEYTGSCGAPVTATATLDAFLGTRSSLGTGTVLNNNSDGIFIAAGSAGDALVGFSDQNDSTYKLRAFEEPGSGGGGGGGGTGAGGGGVGGGGSSGGVSPITAPSKAVLKGPIPVKENIATIEFQCNGVYECGLVMSLLGAKPKKAAASIAKVAKPFAQAKGKVAPGTTKKFKLKLSAAAKKKLKAAKKHKLTVYVRSVVTISGLTSTVVQKATLKL